MCVYRALLRIRRALFVCEYVWGVCACVGERKNEREGESVCVRCACACECVRVRVGSVCVCVYRALLQICRALLQICRALLQICRALLQICRALFCVRVCVGSVGSVNVCVCVCLCWCVSSREACCCLCVSVLVCVEQGATCVGSVNVGATLNPEPGLGFVWGVRMCEMCDVWGECVRVCI